MSEGGRPLKLDQEMLDKAIEYVDGGWKKDGRAIPMLEGLALHLDLYKDTCREWQKIGATYNEEFVKRHGEEVFSIFKTFSSLVNKMEQMQAVELANGSLKKDLDARTANMMLSKHGYVERKETDITTKGKSINSASNLTDDELNARIIKAIKSAKD